MRRWIVGLALAMVAGCGAPTGPSGEPAAPNGHALALGQYTMLADGGAYGVGSLTFRLQVEAISATHISGTWGDFALSGRWADGDWQVDGYRLVLDARGAILKLTPTGSTGAATCTAVVNPGPGAQFWACTVTGTP